MIGILGWAFKANTNDSRESAAIKVSEILYQAGASLIIYDPKVQKKSILNDIETNWSNSKSKKNIKINYAKKFIDTKKCDAFVILTEWEEFKKIDVEDTKIIFDGRNFNENHNKISIGK